MPRSQLGTLPSPVATPLKQTQRHGADVSQGEHDPSQNQADCRHDVDAGSYTTQTVTAR